MNTFRLPWTGEVAGSLALSGADDHAPPPIGRTLLGKPKYKRLPVRSFKNPEVQKRFGVILAGKMLGIAALFGAIFLFYFLFETAAGASPAQAAKAGANTISAINTMWVLVAAFLVFFMQAGFMALEAGFARSRESVNIMMECIFDTCLCGLLYFAIGFAFQFGAGSLIGSDYFFLHGAPATYDYVGAFDTGVAFLAFFLFQFAFADTASTITSGAMVGRTSFKGDILTIEIRGLQPRVYRVATVADIPNGVMAIMIKPEWAAESFPDVEEDVRQSLRRIELSPFVTKHESLRGFVFDVATGKLNEVTL